MPARRLTLLMQGSHGRDTLASGVAVITAAAGVVACCTAGPVLLGVASSLALGALVGLSAGVATLIALTALVIGTRRRHAPEVDRRGERDQA
jgi:hypothetical protein